MKARVYPNFLIVGAAKAGTTSIYEYLKDHPDIYFSPVKEPTFFPYKKEARPIFTNHRPVNFITDENDYFSLYEKANNQKAIGEASTPYLYLHKKTIQGIKDTIPNYQDLKIIIILRNPIDRAFSQYMMKRRDLMENMSFSDAIRNEEKRILDGIHIDFHYLKRGMYYEQVKAYQENFHHVKILFFDDLTTQPYQLIASCLNFLNIDNKFLAKIDEKFNVSGEPKSIFLRSLIMENFIGKNFLQKIIPKNIRLYVGKKIDEKNLKKVKMDNVDRVYLENYFSEDLKKLRSIVPGVVPIWLDI